VYLQGWGNNEQQWYTDLPCNPRVEDSNLVLQAVLDPAAEAVPGRPYTSAKVRTHGRFAVGPSPEHPEVKVEARIKVPAGLGLWPAFWMLPEDGASPYCSGQGQHGGWAASGEVDVMETGNDARMVNRWGCSLPGACTAFHRCALREAHHCSTSTSQVVGSIHYGGPWPYNTQSSGSYSLGGASLADEFHTFGIEWTTKQVRFDRWQAGPSLGSVWLLCVTPLLPFAHRFAGTWTANCTWCRTVVAVSCHGGARFQLAAIEVCLSA
jgi:beta-glucanase (GH16 family)